MHYNSDVKKIREPEFKKNWTNSGIPRNPFPWNPGNPLSGNRGIQEITISWKSQCPVNGIIRDTRHEYRDLDIFFCITTFIHYFLTKEWPYGCLMIGHFFKTFNKFGEACISFFLKLKHFFQAACTSPQGSRWVCNQIRISSSFL